MTTRRLIGPVTSMAAVGLVGVGLWLANVSQTPAPPAQIADTSVAPAVAEPPAPAPSTTAAPQGFPAQAEYVADIPVRGRVLTVEITVDGQNARAYACDNAGIETWLSGPAVDGAVRLTDNTGADRLTGALRNGSVVGTLWVGDRSWEFNATEVGDDYAN
jgi:hypothetical protein